ncbi:hypothetical protein [Photobacterium sp. TLY01]|uniref:hypothetical protein n=1 Tax=Photobacterium sp. TLY01 TaxID=2907534 RepID=UPI001F23CFB5|nr:hypothetical protein [Photobacterium sp. TLY01]UIP29011.1 hypothetical protein LN341_05940 [Photobacterium sp. TLY01]
MSELWQDTCVGILLCCAVSLSPVLDRSVSPEGLFQASPEASQYDGGAWQNLLNSAALNSLSEQRAGAAETMMMNVCPGDQGGQIIWQLEASEI